MKTLIKSTFFLGILAMLLNTSCRKKKNEPTPENPPETPNTQEVITTFKILLTDSASNTIYTYFYKDPDGDGGQSGFYGPGTNTTSTQTDSILTLTANTTYFAEILLLDETKNPIDTISKEVEEEGADHMFFFNSTNPSGSPYGLTLAGSGIKITYTDLDNGSPQRGIGLKSRWRTYGIAAKSPLNIILKHQPGVKDGTISPGDTDIDINFKITIN